MRRLELRLVGQKLQSGLYFVKIAHDRRVAVKPKLIVSARRLQEHGYSPENCPRFKSDKDIPVAGKGIKISPPQDEKFNDLRQCSG